METKTVLLRVVGAGLLGTIAGIHLHLWLQSYRHIPTIGPLFLFNVVVSILLALAILGIPRRLLWLGLGAGSAFAGATLGGLVISLTAGLFQFQEQINGPLVPQTIVVESVAIVILGIAAAILMPKPRWARSPRDVPSIPL
ncbi:MAG: hypothetical protein ACRDWB_02185 [Acidimicrobiales bacterium]